MNSSAVTEALEARRQKIRLWYLMYVVGCVVVVILFFLNRQIMAAFALVLLVLYVFALRPMMKKLRLEFSRENVRVSTGALFEDFSHEVKKGIAPEVIDQAGLVPVSLKKGFISREYMTGRNGRLRVEAADISSSYMTQQGGKQRHAWVAGAWTHVTLPAGTGQDLRIVHKGMMDEGLCRKYFEHRQGLVCLRTGNETVDEHFFVYGAEGGLPSSRFLRLLVDLQQYTPGQVSLALRADKLHVLITSRFLSFSGLPLNEPVSQKLVDTMPFPEMEKILELARACDTQRQ